MQAYYHKKRKKTRGARDVRMVLKGFLIRMIEPAKRTWCPIEPGGSQVAGFRDTPHAIENIVIAEGLIGRRRLSKNARGKASIWKGKRDVPMRAGPILTRRAVASGIKSNEPYFCTFPRLQLTRYILWVVISVLHQIRPHTTSPFLLICCTIMTIFFCKTAQNPTVVLMQPTV
jgi:hypothetical protein